MTLLQLGIGTVNDVVDAVHDRGLKPGKPIPSGLVEPRVAKTLAAACFVAGVVLAWSRGPLAGLVALLVVIIGLAYDLRLKGTAWSWLPFAVGIPILPLFGWVASTSSIPGVFLVVVPVGMAAGAALAIANSLVDVERDEAAGRTSVAAVLGVERSGRVSAALYVLVTSVAVGSGIAAKIPIADAVVLLVAGAAASVAAVTAARRSPAGRERSWQIEALALAVLAVAWVRAVVT
jgi:4-hydroxybenzoate polyprenyltransferase